MSSSLSDKTPAQSCNDLLYLNNDNIGVTSDLVTVYGGNGIPTPLKLSTEKMEASFNKGALVKPVIDSYHLKYNDIGEVGATYQISTTAGNVQKLTLTENLSLTFLHNLDEGSAFELTLLVEQSTGGHTVSFPSSFRKPGQTNITLSSTANAIDVLKLLTYNGGEDWLVYKEASDLR
jgi:hypothetical protein